MCSYHTLIGSSTIRKSGSNSIFSIRADTPPTGIHVRPCLFKRWTFGIVSNNNCPCIYESPNPLNMIPSQASLQVNLQLNTPIFYHDLHDGLEYRQWKQIDFIHSFIDIESSTSRDSGQSCQWWVIHTYYSECDIRISDSEKTCTGNLRTLSCPFLPQFPS